MAAPTNHFKLGLFVILGMAGAVVALFLFGAAAMGKETTDYHTYFNESVQGLEVGSPVKFRGVTIGHVQKIAVAPDHRLVDVVSDLLVKDIKRMGLLEEGSATAMGPTKFSIPPDLRAQLGSQGVTGMKFIAMDFFDPKSNPAPEVTFKLPERYIPAAPSMMKNLEDTIQKAMDRLPDMVDAVVMIMGRVDRLLASLEKEEVSGKIGSTLTGADNAMASLQRVLGGLEKERLGERTGKTIDQAHAAIAKLDAVLGRLDGDKGLLASIRHTSDAFGEMGRSGAGTQRDLEATLHDVSDAAEAVRSLAAALERDPDMLLKGKTKAKTP